MDIKQNMKMHALEQEAKKAEERAQKVRERIAAEDKKAVEYACTQGQKRRDGITEMRRLAREKCGRRCPKDGYTFAKVFDDGKDGVFIAGAGRYAEITYTGYCYSLRLQGNVVCQSIPDHKDVNQAIQMAYNYVMEASQ